MFKLIALISIFFINEAFAQNDNLSPSSLSRIGEVLPPSPNASSLGKFGGIPMNLSSGRANVNIPLYEVKTSNLQIPIGLSYSSSGFSVNEIASRVGHSWNLSIGGVITRTILDGPDELSQHLPVPNDFGPGDNQAVLNYLEAIEQSTYDIADVQHDIFNFNFGNYQGKFIIDGSNVILLQNQNLKIRTSLIEINYIDGCTFQIITPDGTLYYFGGPNASEYSGSESFGNNCGNEKDFNMNGTAWYLKKIVHPTGDFITFTYSSVNFTYKYSIHQSETRAIRLTEVFCSSTGPLITNANSTCVTELISHGVKLDRISTSNGQNIDIEYQSREDLPGDYLVKNIIIYKNNSTSLVYKKFHLEYEQSISIDYINSWNNEDALKKHVFLHSVTERDALNNAGKGQYLFEYNAIAELPPRLSFAQDYWGFFNGKNNPSLVYLTQSGQAVNNTTSLYAIFNAGANRNSDPTFAQKGLLKKVIYPTGGADEIMYESHQHRFLEEQTDIQNFNVNVSDICYNDAIPKIAETTFTPSQSQQISLSISCNYIGTDSYDPPADRVEFSVLNVTDNFYLILENTLVAGNNQPAETNVSISLVGGKTYKIILKIWGQDVFASGNLTYQNQNTTTFWSNRAEGGVRVKETTSINNNKSENIKRYIYSPIEDFTISSCDVIGYNFENLSRTRQITRCASDCSATEVLYYTVSSSSYNNIALFGGSPISYRSVIEANGVNFENGATEYKYSMEADEWPEKLYGVNPLSTPYTNSDFNNGLLIYKRVLQKTTTGWLNKTEEIYSYNTDNRVENNYYDYTVRKNYQLCDFLPGMLKEVPNYGGLTPFDVYRYLVRKRWIYPETIITKQYSPDGLMSVNTQTIEEHANTYNIKPSKITTSTSSINKSISKVITYSQDIFQTVQPQWLTNLKNVGYLEAPIEELAIKKIDNVDYVTGGQLFIYDNSVIKPAQIYTLKLAAPVLLSGFSRCSVTSGTFTFDSRYENEINVLYNSIYGNTKSVATNNTLKVYLWDYSNSYPIAETNNATFDQIAYTSFEAENPGNWTYGGTPITELTSPTGKKAYQVNNPISKDGLSPVQTYIVSYWRNSNAGPYTVAGSISGNGYPKSGRNVNGWTYYEHKVTGVSATSISGSGLIDEVRFYPKDALMTTYTYEPLIGMTSQTDANSRIIYYDYDAFGRLLYIKDQDKNIIKAIDYKYQQQQ
jgi:YD repeat-containing protein